MSRFVPEIWRTRAMRNHGHTGGRKFGKGLHGEKINPHRDWEKGGIRTFEQKSFNEREKAQNLWNSGKFIVFCYVCGHRKSSDHFQESERLAIFPWCIQCQQEDEEDSLAV